MQFTITKPGAAILACATFSGAAVWAQPIQSANFPQEFRTIDGVGNNLTNPDLGSAGSTLLRLMPAAYADGVGVPVSTGRPSARTVSNTVCAQSGLIPNTNAASDYIWAWGQFLDHDLDLTGESEAEHFDIRVPLGDVFFDPFFTGAEIIELRRSLFDMVGGVRNHPNAITSYIDGSNVYGSDLARANELRTLDGTGKMKTSPGDFLPFNVNGFDNAGGTDPSLFLAGDVRANEQAVLTALHTLFVREHNFWAQRLIDRGFTDGEVIYEFARAIVGAELQAITYNEWLPALLGPDPIPAYAGYQAGVIPSVSNLFSAAAFRMGHTMLSPTLRRLQSDGTTHPAGDIALLDAFFNPDAITSVGIDPYMRGLGAQLAQRVDPFVIDDVRNFLFGPPGAGGFDLASLNLQRGRDHGIPSYSEVRAVFGPGPLTSFDDITSDQGVRDSLDDAYNTLESIDAWIGMLSEDHAPGALVGPTLKAIMAEQFQRLRDGDRFWHEAYLPAGLTAALQQNTLAVIIRRNTDVGAELQDNVFEVAGL